MSRPGARSSLAVRIGLVCAGAAVVGALVSGVLAARLVTTAAREGGREALAAQADVVAGQLADAPGRSRATRAVLDVLGEQGIELAVVSSGSATGAGAEVLRAVDVTDLAAGRDVSQVRRDGRSTYLVEGRSTASGGGVALVQEAERASAPVVRRLAGRVVLAVVVGAVTAVLAGTTLAWLVARPLRAAAAAVAELRAGRRDVRVQVEGPEEVARLATGVNDLADALARSEAREREFLLSVSHDLRTPLTAVRGVAEALADGVVTGEDDVRRSGTVVLEQAQRLDRMVADLLDLARLGTRDVTLDLLPVDLAGLVAATADGWRDRAAAAGARVETELARDQGVVTDAARVRQVLDSLCDNAIRHLGDGDVLVLAVTEHPEGAVLEVRDSGPGLDLEDYPVAFERGVLAERHRSRRPGGAGIGLSLVRALVTRLGASAEAGPAPEGGACFRVVLPRTAPIGQEGRAR